MKSLAALVKLASQNWYVAGALASALIYYGIFSTKIDNLRQDVDQLKSFSPAVMREQIDEQRRDNADIKSRLDEMQQDLAFIRGRFNTPAQ